MPSTAFVSLTLSLAISSASLASAFSHARLNAKVNHHTSSTELNYHSLHQWPDMEPLSDMEKLGAGFKKIDKDKIHQYGPGDFTHNVESTSSHLFYGGDSEMGLSGGGNTGIKMIGPDVSPHMARTLSAKMDQATASSMSYSDELLQNNPGMNATRAQQLENLANQQEIAKSNKYMYMNSEGDCNQGHVTSEEYGYGDMNEVEALFSYPLQAGDDVEGTVPLRAPYGVATHEIMIKNIYMGFANFRAGFVGDEANEWSVTPSVGYLKQHEDTHFVLRYAPHSLGSSSAYFVIETEDLKKTWKVVGSTGEYKF